MRHLLMEIHEIVNKEATKGQEDDITVESSQNNINHTTNQNNQGSRRKQEREKVPGALFQGGFIEFTLPIILRYALKKPLGVLWASVISSAPIILSFLYSVIFRKVFSPFPIIMILSIYVGLGFQLGFTDERLQELGGTAICAALGLLMLITIPFKKPFLYYLAKPFVNSGDDKRASSFEDNWLNPQMRGPNRKLCLLWSIGLFIIAALNAAIVMLIPEHYKIWIELTSEVITDACVIILVVFGIRYRMAKAKQLTNNQNQEQPDNLNSYNEQTYDNQQPLNNR